MLRTPGFSVGVRIADDLISKAPSRVLHCLVTDIEPERPGLAPQRKGLQPPPPVVDQPPLDWVRYVAFTDRFRGYVVIGCKLAKVISLRLIAAGHGRPWNSLDVDLWFYTCPAVGAIHFLRYVTRPQGRDRAYVARRKGWCVACTTAQLTLNPTRLLTCQLFPMIAASGSKARALGDIHRCTGIYIV